MLKNPTYAMYTLFSERVEHQTFCISITYKVGDEEYQTNLHMATLSATQVVVSLLPCTVHDGIQWQ